MELSNYVIGALVFLGVVAVLYRLLKRLVH